MAVRRKNTTVTQLPPYMKKHIDENVGATGKIGMARVSLESYEKFVNEGLILDNDLALGILKGTIQGRDVKNRNGPQLFYDRIAACEAREKLLREAAVKAAALAELFSMCKDLVAGIDNGNLITDTVNSARDLVARYESLMVPKPTRARRTAPATPPPSEPASSPPSPGPDANSSALNGNVVAPVANNVSQMGNASAMYGQQHAMASASGSNDFAANNNMFLQPGYPAHVVAQQQTFNMAPPAAEYAGNTNSFAMPMQQQTFDNAPVNNDLAVPSQHMHTNCAPVTNGLAMPMQQSAPIVNNYAPVTIDLTEPSQQIRTEYAPVNNGLAMPSQQIRTEYAPVNSGLPMPLQQIHTEYAPVNSGLPMPSQQIRTEYAPVNSGLPMPMQQIHTEYAPVNSGLAMPSQQSVIAPVANDNATNTNHFLQSGYPTEVVEHLNIDMQVSDDAPFINDSVPSVENNVTDTEMSGMETATATNTAAPATVDNDNGHTSYMSLMEDEMIAAFERSDSESLFGDRAFEEEDLYGA